MDGSFFWMLLQALGFSLSVLHTYCCTAVAFGALSLGSVQNPLGRNAGIQQKCRFFTKPSYRAVNERNRKNGND